MNLHVSRLWSRGPSDPNPVFMENSQGGILGQRKLNKEGIMALLPKPDRSSFRPKLSSMDESRELDHGWAEGEFKDGRPYRAELWSWDHLSAVTFFFSAVGIKNFSDQEVVDLLQREAPLQLKEKRRVSAEKMADSSGNEMWCVSLLLQDGEEKLAEIGFQFKPYEEAQEEGNSGPPRNAIRSRVLKF